MRDPRVQPVKGDILDGGNEQRRQVWEDHPSHDWIVVYRLASVTGDTQVQGLHRCGIAAWRAWAKNAHVTYQADDHG
jgi:hypothetical protein